MKYLPFLSLLLLAGCYTIPQAPDRDQELMRKCSEWNYKRAVLIREGIDSQMPYKDLLGLSQDLIWGTEASMDWVGKPEKEYTGDIKKLAAKMDDNDNEYRKSLAEWKQEVNTYAGLQVTDTGSMFKWGAIIVALVIGAFLLIRRIPFL